MYYFFSLLLLVVIGMGPTPVIPVSEIASSNEQGHTAVASPQTEIFAQTNRDHGTDECPTGNASTRRLVEIVIQDTDRAENYASGGTWGATPEDIRMLTDDTDADVCQFFNDGVPEERSTPPWLSAYYKAGNYYFIASRYQLSEDQMFRLGHGSVVVFDSELNVIGAFAV